MAYTPTVWATGDVVTAEKLNKLENGVEDASAKELPTVSGTDNGDVLTVVEGVWAKAAQNNSVFIINVSHNVSGETHTFTTDKTWQEIHDAIINGKMCLMIENESENPDVAIYCWPVLNVLYYSDESAYSVNALTYLSNTPLDFYAETANGYCVYTVVINN